MELSQIKIYGTPIFESAWFWVVFLILLFK